MIIVEAEKTWRMPVVEGMSTALGVEGEETEIFEAPACLSALHEVMPTRHQNRGTKECSLLNKSPSCIRSEDEVLISNRLTALDLCTNT